MTIKVDLSAFKRFQKDLSVLKEKQIPHAVRDTLNAVAFEGRREWEKQAQKQLVLRNRYTVQSMRVQRATGVQLSSMQSTLGSLAPYMGEREEGARHVMKGGHVGVPIPTPAAGGQIRARIRTRPIRKASFLKAISIPKRLRGGRRQVRNAASIAMALRAGDKFTYLDLGKKKGIFRLDGLKRGLRVRMLYDLSKRETKPKAKPTLGKTLQVVAPRIPMLGRAAVLKQIAMRFTGYGRRR